MATPSSKPDRVILTRMVETCPSCPSQWDGWTEQGRQYYFRYRWGHLRVDRVEAGQHHTLLELSLGDPLDGVLDYPDLVLQLDPYGFEFPLTYTPFGADQE
jgi:hypothetical protein